MIQSPISHKTKPMSLDSIPLIILIDWLFFFLINRISFVDNIRKAEKHKCMLVRSISHRKIKGHQLVITLQKYFENDLWVKMLVFVVFRSTNWTNEMIAHSRQNGKWIFVCIIAKFGWKKTWNTSQQLNCIRVWCMSKHNTTKTEMSVSVQTIVHIQHAHRTTHAHAHTYYLHTSAKLNTFFSVQIVNE